MSKIKSSVFIVGIIFSCIISAVGTYFGLVAGGVIETSNQEITVTLKDVEYEYDGLEHTPNDFEVDGTFLSEGHYVVPRYFSSAVDAGRYSIGATVDVYDKSGKNVSDQYTVTVVPANVTINPKKIALKLDAASKQYDGTPLTSESFTTTSGSLAYGHSVVPSYTGSAIEVSDDGKKVYGQMTAEIYSLSGVNVTSNYNITIDNSQAELLITKRPVVITTLSISKEFDGQVLNPADYANNVSITGLLDNHEMTYQFIDDCVFSNVNSMQSELKSTSLIITEGADEVTKNYEIIVQDVGMLTITPCEVYTEAKLESLTFNGTNQSSLSISLYDLLPYNTANKLEELDYQVILEDNQEFDLLNAGTYEYVINYKIVDNKQIDMTSCFTNSSLKAIIVINPLDVHVSTPNIIEFEYNGRPYSIDPEVNLDTIVALNYKVEDEEKSLYTLLDRINYDVNITVPQYTDLGTYTNIVDVDFTKNGFDRSYNFNLIYDEDNIKDLIITKRKISVSPVAVETEYTGSKVTATEISISKLDSEGNVDINNNPLVYGHTYTCSISGGGVDASSNPYETNAEITIFDRDGNNVTSNYDITYTPSTVKINKRAITITGKSEDFTYDGSEEYRTEVVANNIASATNLLEGMEVTATYKDDSKVSLSQMSHENTISSVLITLGADSLNTDNFSITNYPGMLHLKYGTIKYTVSQLTELVYDKTNLVSKLKVDFGSGYEVLTNNCSIDVVNSDKIINAGTYKNINLSFTFSDDDAQSIANNVTFTCSEESVIVVKPYSVYITLENRTEEFNGQELGLKETFVANSEGEQSSLLANDYFVFESDKVLKPNSGTPSVDAIYLNHYILDSAGNDVTQNYNVVGPAIGDLVKLEYAKKSITFIGSDVEITYGDEFNSNKFSISPVETLPSGYYGKPYDVYVNEYEDNKIYYSVNMYGTYLGQEIVVNDFYEVDTTTNPGKVVINPLNVSVTTFSTAVYYDGSTVEHPQIVISSSLLDIVDFYFEAVGPECGTYSNVCTYVGDIEENYLNITYNFGTITIMPVPVVVTTKPIVVTYGYDSNDIVLSYYYTADNPDFLENIELNFDNPTDYQDVGTYNLNFEITNSNAYNYSTTLPTVSLIVEKKPITFTTTPIILEYGEAFPDDLSPYIRASDDTLAINYSTDFIGVVPNKYTTSVSTDLDTDCYDVENISLTVIINKKKVTFTTTPIILEYGDDFPADLSTYIRASDDTLAINYSTDFIGVVPNKYTTSVSTDLEPNYYDVENISLTVIINKKKVTFTTTPIILEYGEAFPADLSPYITPSDNTLAINYSTGFSETVPDTYITTVSTNLDPNCYDVENISLTVVIKKKNLTVTADNVTKTLAVYEADGINIAEFNITDDSGAELSFTVNTEGLGVGTYVLPVLLDAEYQANYNYTPITVTITITA